MNKKPSKRQQQLEECAKLLEQGVKKLMQGDAYRNFLDFRQKFFHPYSIRNLLLIQEQYSGASMIAGYKTWQKLGRQVIKGQKSIKIYAPTRKKIGVTENAKTGEEEPVYGHYFVPVPVFDISQTEGEEIPRPPRPENLAKEEKNVEPLIETLVDYAVEQGTLVDFKALENPELKGYYRPATKEIVINTEGGNRTQQLKTLVHEIAHNMMHENLSKKERHIGELEAESMAYIVCNMLGIDTSGYTFAYLLNWASDIKEVLPAAQKAATAADEVLEYITNAFTLKSEGYIEVKPLVA